MLYSSYIRREEGGVCSRYFIGSWVTVKLSLCRSDIITGGFQVLELVFWRRPSGRSPLAHWRALRITMVHCREGRKEKLGRGPRTVERFLLHMTTLWPLAAQTAITVDLKSGLLSSRACALSHPVEEPYFPSKHNTHLSALHCTVLTRRKTFFLNLSMT